MYVTGNGGVPGHRLWREVIIAVRSVQEGLPALTVDKVCLENEPRSWAGHGIQGTPSRRCAIVHIKTHSLRSPQGTCRPGSRLHNYAHFGGKKKREREKEKKKYLQVFCLYISAVLLQRWLEIYSISKGDCLKKSKFPGVQLLSPVQNRGKFLRHRSFFLFHSEFTPALGCSEVTVCFLFCIAKGGTGM